MKTINIRSQNSFAISDTRMGAVTRMFSVSGTIQYAMVNGNVGVVTVQQGRAAKNYVYDLDRGTLQRIYSVASRRP